MMEWHGGIAEGSRQIKLQQMLCQHPGWGANLGQIGAHLPFWWRSAHNGPPHAAAQTLCMKANTRMSIASIPHPSLLALHLLVALSPGAASKVEHEPYLLINR